MIGSIIQQNNLQSGYVLCSCGPFGKPKTIWCLRKQISTKTTITIANTLLWKYAGNGPREDSPLGQVA